MDIEFYKLFVQTKMGLADIKRMLVAALDKSNSCQVAFEDCLLLKGDEPANLNVSPMASKEVETAIVACRQSPLAPVHIVIPAVQKEGSQDKEQQVLPPIDLLSTDLMELTSPKSTIPLS